MKNIIDYINEGILDDPEIALSKTAEEIMYPVPTVKDFVKRGALTVEWYCPGIVQKYIELYKSDISIIAKDKFISLVAYIFNDKSIQIMIKRDHKYMCDLPISGLQFDNVKDYKTAKQCVIDLFNCILKNPDVMKTLIEHSNEYRVKGFGKLNVSKLIKQ